MDWMEQLNEIEARYREVVELLSDPGSFPILKGLPNSLRSPSASRGSLRRTGATDAALQRPKKAGQSLKSLTMNSGGLPRKSSRSWKKRPARSKRNFS